MSVKSPPERIGHSTRRSRPITGIAETQPYWFKARFRVNSEIDSKCPQWKDRVVVPRLTRAQGRTLTAVVEVKALGSLPQAGWGYQVLMQSNEGFPDKTDLLTRKVNEYEGQHRFGGGTDYDNDPHVIDILVPPGGDPVKRQYELLGKHNKAATTPVKPEDLAVVPLVYPCAR